MGVDIEEQVENECSLAWTRVLDRVVDDRERPDRWPSTKHADKRRGSG